LSSFNLFKSSTSAQRGRVSIMKLMAYCASLKERLSDYGVTYLPSVGGISLVSLSSTVMEKQFLRNSLGDLQVIVKDVLWWYSHVGIGTWIYQRKHLHTTGTMTRLSFSVAGSLVFNQGVMLLLAMLRLRLPNCKHVTIPLGVGACFGLVHLGRVYGHHCDSPHLFGTSGNSVSSTTTSLPNNGASSTQLSSKSPSPKSHSPSLEPDASSEERSMGLSLA